MLRTTILALFLALGLFAFTTPARADTANLPPNFASWSNYDDTVYMISTLNDVYVSNGIPLPRILIDRYGVTRYAVWQDLVTGTYVTQFKRANGSNAGMVVNRLGWPLPLSHSRLTDTLGVPRPTIPVEQHFQTHAKLLLGSLPADSVL